MKFGSIVVASLIVIALFFLGAANANRQAAEGQIKHGEYIVHHVAMCVQCHSPRDEEGELIETRLLEGAPMPVESPFPNKQWAFRAPTIAGLPGWRDEDIMALLQTGKRLDGSSPKPPMPPFRLSPEDAAAVVAYLKSL